MKISAYNLLIKLLQSCYHSKRSFIWKPWKWLDSTDICKTCHKNSSKSVKCVNLSNMSSICHNSPDTGIDFFVLPSSWGIQSMILTSILRKKGKTLSWLLIAWAWPHTWSIHVSMSLRLTSRVGFKINQAWHDYKLNLPDLFYIKYLH